MTCHAGGGPAAGALGALVVGFGFVVGAAVVVVVFGRGTRSNRAATSFTPATPVIEHERFVPAEAHRPTQPANREPLAGVAVRVTLSPASGYGNEHDDEHEPRIGGSVTASNLTTPSPVPVSTILATSVEAADETAATARPITKLARAPATPTCRIAQR
jgi:hypothetical protein